MAITFSHSGNLGDIIYSLPTVKALCERFNDQAIYYLTHSRQHINMVSNHPFGYLMMTEKAAQMLKPLLEVQPYIERVELVDAKDFNPDNVNYNFDEMREMGIDYSIGDIPHWHELLVRKYYGHGDLRINTSEPYIEIDKNEVYTESDGSIMGLIVIARSSRYRNPEFDYSILNGLPLTFVGLPEEYSDFTKVCKGAYYYKVEDFKQSAHVISKCQTFFGNQTFLYSLAEAMKVKRYLEVAPMCPNVRAVNNGIELKSQEQFIEEVKKLKGDY